MEENNSVYLQTQASELTERIKNADAYFLMHPEAGANRRFQAMYEEMTVRRTFIQDAETLLTVMLDNNTNTDRALELCDKLYEYSVSEFMYKSEAEAQKYLETIAQLQRDFPNRDQKIVFAIRNISAAQQTGASLTRYRKALRIFVETVVEYFLWIREAYAPIPAAKKKESDAEAD